MSATRVDFCHIKDLEKVSSFVCRSLLRLVDKGMKVLVRTDNPTDAEDLDRKLWLFRPAFISHEMCDAHTDPRSFDHLGAQVVIGDKKSHWPCPALLNLSLGIVKDFEDFDRVVEIVKPDPDCLVDSRLRYAYYQKSGCLLHYHKIL